MSRKCTRADGEAGAILVIATAGIVLAMIASALAVDLGRLASDKRTDQKIADMAAIDASRNIASACVLANASAVRNGLPANSLTCDPASPADATKDVIVGKMSAGTFTPDATGDAVQVTVKSAFKAAFPFVSGRDHTSGKAVAGSASEAAFSVGSSLADFDADRSVLDKLMAGWLTGITNAQLSALSYNGLAGGNVSLRALQTGLTGLSYTVGSPTQLLTTQLTVIDLLKATASAFSASGQSTVEVDKLIASSISSTLKVKLGDLVNLAAPGSSSALDTTVNVFHLVTGAAQVANGSSFVATGLCVTAALVSVCTKVKVIERAQVAEGPVGTTTHNSQAVLQLAIPVAGVGTVNVEVTAADAEATLKTITCGSPPGISLGATTSAATLGGVTTIAGIGFTVSGALAAGSPIADQAFGYTSDFLPPVGAGTARQVGASTLDLTPASLTVTPSPSNVLTATTAATIKTTLDLVLPALGPVLDPLLQPTLKGLGLEVAAADLAAINIFPAPPTCGKPHLLG